jgi:anti-sigma regulatory factor (Ser/Thr protein kinase)
VAGLSQAVSAAADEPPAAGCVTLAAEYDWSESDFGPQDQWDSAVEAVVRTLLEATAPMAYCHGAGYAMVYNDRFAGLLGARHPRAWGQRAALVMPEIWSRPGYADAVNNVFAGRRSFHDEGAMLDLSAQEQSHPDWTYLARSYSAVRDREGSVLGVLVVVVEMAPVLVLLGGTEEGDHGAKWRGAELWDETVARRPLIWSGFRAGARSPETPSEPDQRFVAEGDGPLILPINGPDIGGSMSYRRLRRHLPDGLMLTMATREQNDDIRTGPSGDFYDVFAVPDGRIALTIGAVIGAGTASAAVTAQVKVSLRAAALTSSDPSVIFTALDAVISHLDRGSPAVQTHSGGLAEAGGPGFGGELMVTALFGVFDPATGDLRLASAGHLPPAVVRRRPTTGAPASSEPLAQYARLDPGPPLGIAGTRPVMRSVLHEGDALVAVTEGLLERHEQSLAQLQSALLATLNTMSATAARSISEHVIDTLVGDKGLEHDCALLVVVRDSRAHEMACVLVPPHTIAVRGARRWARAQLQSWGVSEQNVASAVLCISELVTNVVQHAGTAARVSMELAERLLVTVEDTGTWSAPRAGREDHSASQGRGLALVAATSDGMGHARAADGSTVWFEIALERSTAP